eukprot:scaffold23097_cov20-Tisochrysis_lutea.AAC.4
MYNVTWLSDNSLKFRMALRWAHNVRDWQKWAESRGGRKATLNVALQPGLMSVLSGNTCDDTKHHHLT